MPIAREPEDLMRHAPMRTCVGCRVSSTQDDLLRVQLVADDEGSVRRVEPSVRRRERAGRGAYLCPRRSCLDQAIKRRAFTRAFSSRSSEAQAKPGAPGIESMSASAAETLWTNAIAQVRREIELLGRSFALSSHPGTRAENPHAQPRLRGLERLLSELECSPNLPVRPTPLDRRPRSNGQGGTPTHG